MLDPLLCTDELLVLNKPSDVSLLADRSGAPNLWDALRSASYGKPYLVHRLDKGTSGVLLVALTQKCQTHLTKLFATRQVKKYYVAHVSQPLALQGTGLINLPLRKGRKSRYRVAGERRAILRQGNTWSLVESQGTAQGLQSATRLRRLQPDSPATCFIVQPVSGRTHQIRVHLAWTGHALRGDTLYGSPSDTQQQASRLQLHCHKVIVPGVGTFCAPLENQRDFLPNPRSVLPNKDRPSA